MPWELTRAAFVSGKYWPFLSAWVEEGAKNYAKVSAQRLAQSWGGSEPVGIPTPTHCEQIRYNLRLADSNIGC